MPDKLPIDLPASTPGAKIVHAVNTDDLTDGPQGTSQKVDVNDFTTQSLTAPTFEDARFFSELGLADTQGWVITANIPATVTIVTETVNGIPQDVHKLFDDGSGIATVARQLTAQNWQDIYDLDASFSGEIRLDSTDGDAGCFWGLGVLAADSPVGDANKRRFGLNIKKSLTTNELNVSGSDGNALDVDVAGAKFDEYNEIGVKITRSIFPSSPVAEVFVNGVSIGMLDLLVHVGGTGTECSWSSGSSGGTDRVTYMSNFGVTIYTSDNEILVGDLELNVDTAVTILPPGNRDYLISLAESITGSELGNGFQVTALNIGGTIAVNNENPANPKALFNGLASVSVPVREGLTILGVNSVAGGNAYQFDIPTQPLLSLETLILAKSVAASQEPSALDTPIQIEYGAFQSTPQVDISALGTVLFNQAGTYYITIHGQYGAPAGGGEAALRFRAELNGQPASDVLSSTIPDAKTSVPLTVAFFIAVSAGDELETFLLRDSSESNKGGLFQEATALAGWDASPCASIRIERLLNT